MAINRAETPLGKYRIVSDGCSIGTRVEDRETGEIIQDVVSVSYNIRINGIGEALITLSDINPEVSVDGEIVDASLIKGKISSEPIREISDLVLFLIELMKTTSPKTRVFVDCPGVKKISGAVAFENGILLKTEN